MARTLTPRSATVTPAHIAAAVPQQGDQLAAMHPPLTATLSATPASPPPPPPVDHPPRRSWLAAAFTAIVVAEWLIHVPLFNVLLGFPIQFIGLVMTPYLVLRYYVDKEGTPLSDAEASPDAAPAAPVWPVRQLPRLLEGPADGKGMRCVHGQHAGLARQGTPSTSRRPDVGGARPQPIPAGDCQPINESLPLQRADAVLSALSSVHRLQPSALYRKAFPEPCLPRLPTLCRSW